jgi:transcriptional regulator with XRE-family HTH domain
MPANNLARWRRLRGWSQAELADRCEVHQVQISRIEAGRIDPRLSTALRIYDGFLSDYQTPIWWPDLTFEALFYPTPVEPELERLEEEMPRRSDRQRVT